MEQEGAAESTNDEPALDVKQEEATDENTNPQSSETDNTDDLMEQSPCESNQQGRSGEVQDVDQPTHDQAASVMKQEEATGENTNPQSSETDNTDDPMVQSPCESNQQGRSGEVQGVVLPWKKFFVHLAGKTDSAHRDFVEKFNNIGQTEVDSPEGSDYILVFYPIVSQPEMDIGEAPESAPAGKPIILVVMHHTNNPDLVIAESGRLVNNPNVKLTVDCLFYEGKLLKCRRNETLLIQLKESFGVSETSQRNGQPASNVEQEVATGENTNPDSVNEATEQSPLPWKKFFVHLAGKTDNSHRDFVAKFKSIGQKEAKSPERSDYILVFCPIVSRVGTDIGEALESAPAGKPIILVVMHHTFNPDLVIANSRRLVKNQNVNLTVDCLIYEGELLKSHHNDTAWSEVKKIFGVSEVSRSKLPEITSPSWWNPLAITIPSWSNPFATSKRNDQPALGSRESPNPSNQPSGPAPTALQREMVPAELRKKFFVHLAGKTDNAHQGIVEKFKSISQTEVHSPEGSDYILVFCPIVSRVGTDIGEALESAPAGKPIILVVMHHTFNPDLVIANSRRLVKNPNVQLTVDCLIYEGELLKSHHNETAWSEVKKILGVSEVFTKGSPEKKKKTSFSFRK